MLEDRAADVVEVATERANDAGTASAIGAVREGTSIHREIQSYIEEQDIDLVVLGTHEQQGLRRFLLGSVAENLVRTSPVPVMTIRKSADESQ